MTLSRTLAIAAALVLSPLVIAPAPPASADAPSCYGSTCTDLDPAQTNCADDAITLWSLAATPSISSSTRGVGRLEMRYSARCHANWARFTAWAGFEDGIATLLRGDQEGGAPWIWREGVADVPRGVVSRAGSYLPFTQETTWTAMITADGTTCMSVDLYAYGESNRSPEMPGGFQRTDLGTFDAGCIS